MAKDGGSNLSAVIYGANDLRMEERPTQDPKAGEIQLSMHCTGICGTDVHCLEYGCIGTGVLKVDQPIILGHEGSGTVRKLGPGVDSLDVGDRVVVEVVQPCRTCDHCRTGRYNLCPRCNMMGIPPYHDGSLCRYPIFPASVLHKIPDNVSFEEGAMMEPLTCAVYACKRAEIKLGDTVLVLGAGTIGLLCAQTAKAMGASTVCVTDLKPDRLALAKKLGADYTFQVSSDDAEVEAAKIKGILTKPVDISIECSAATSSIQLGIYATRAGGVLTVVGIGHSMVEIPLFDAMLREVDIRGTLASCRCFPLAIDLVSSGKVDVRSLVTHRVTLEDTPDAFAMVKAGGDGLIKCVVNG